MVSLKPRQHRGGGEPHSHSGQTSLSSRCVKGPARTVAFHPHASPALRLHGVRSDGWEGGPRALSTALGSDRTEPTVPRA